VPPPGVPDPASGATAISRRRCVSRPAWPAPL